MAPSSPSLALAQPLTRLGLAKVRIISITIPAGNICDWTHMVLSSKTRRLSETSAVSWQAPLLMWHRDKSGAMIYLHYGGVVDITPELGLILGGSPDAKTTAFGNSCKLCQAFLFPAFPFSKIQLRVLRFALPFLLLCSSPDNVQSSR